MNNLLFATSFLFLIPLVLAFHLASYDVVGACAMCCISSAANYYSGNAYVRVMDILVVNFLGAFYNISSWKLFQRDRRFAAIWLVSLVVFLFFFLDSYQNSKSHAIVHLLGSMGMCVYVYLKSKCHADLNAFIHNRNVYPALELKEHPFHPLYPQLDERQQGEYLRCYCMHHYGGAYLSSTRQLFEISNVEIDMIKKNDDLWVIMFQEGIVCKSDTPFTSQWIERVHARLDQNLSFMDLFEEVCCEYADHVWDASKCQLR